MRAGALAALSLLLWIAASPSRAAESEKWSGYLDYAYVYCSAEPDALRKRLAEYGSEAGIKLEDYVNVSLGGAAAKAAPDPDAVVRADAAVVALGAEAEARGAEAVATTFSGPAARESACTSRDPPRPPHSTVSRFASVCSVRCSRSSRSILQHPRNGGSRRSCAASCARSW